MLVLDHISKTFGKNTVNEKRVFDQLSLTVNDGDFITVIGANGSGKTTLFNCIAGSCFVDEGNIYLDDRNITFLKEHQRAKEIGRLFQDPLSGTAPHMTIKENLFLASSRKGWLAGINKKDEEYLKEQLSKLQMGLEDRMDSSVSTLSGGQRQALTLLMATVNPPKLLLLDEHTAALDPKSQQQILSLTKETVEKNHLSCMMITHDMEQALSFGNRTLMMNDGKIILDLNAQEKQKYQVKDLLQAFRDHAGKELTSDRILLN